MRILDSRYHRVWKIEEQNGFKKLNLGDSSKKKDGTREYFTWFGCTLIGEAKNTPVSEGDTITILEGVMSQYKNKDGKYVPQLTIFKFEVTKNAQDSVTPFETKSGFTEMDDDSDIPF